ncbi:hypothetical protein FO519_008559 [Halicephalobus sp. NKZ332]|nr:hypothetical protein FO519_008559 [Halicephalobus sp. NKZ332]
MFEAIHTLIEYCVTLYFVAPYRRYIIEKLGERKKLLGKLISKNTVVLVQPNFYFYYSYLTLILCWVLAPIVFYIILTQSKTIGKFKWLILNHTFWCFCLENLLGIVKPVLLAPACGGYQIGFLKNASFKSSVITTILCYFFSLGSIVGLMMTIFSRYMFIFPSKWQRIFYRREFYIFVAFLHIISMFIIFYIMIPTLDFSEKELHEDSMKYDPDLVYFFNRSTFFFIDHSRHDFEDVVFLGGMSVLYVVSIAVVTVFIYQIFSNKNVINDRIQKSLIVSSVAQTTLTCLLLVTPLYCYIIFISHCLFDFCATVYFVKPYRMFLAKMIWKKKENPSFSTIPKVNSEITLRSKRTNVSIH